MFCECQSSSNIMHVQSLTLTSHSSILRVTIGTTDSRATGAVSEVGLTASTANIVQVDRTSASTKMSTAKGNCICFTKSFCSGG